MNFEQIVQKGNAYKGQIANLERKIGALEARVKKFKPDGNEIVINGLSMEFSKKEQQSIWRMVCEKTDGLKAELVQLKEEFENFQKGIILTEEKPKKAKKDETNENKE